MKYEFNVLTYEGKNLFVQGNEASFNLIARELEMDEQVLYYRIFKGESSLRESPRIWLDKFVTYEKYDELCERVLNEQVRKPYEI